MMRKKTSLLERRNAERRRTAKRHKKTNSQPANKAESKETETSAPIAYAYGRISHVLSEEGDAIPAQESRSRAFYETHLEPNGVEWGGFKEEPGHISAYKHAFPKRKVGAELIEILRPGDHLIVDKVDRLWRQLSDFATLNEWFKENEITVHFVDMLGVSATSGTPMGDLLLGIIVMTSELESAVKSERILAQKAYQRSQGYWSAPEAPLGCSVKGKRGKRILVWDHGERQIMQEVVRLRDVEQMSWQDLTYRLNETLEERFPEEFAREEADRSKKRSRQRYKSKNWSKTKICRAYRYELYFKKFTDPMHMDFHVLSELQYRMTDAIQPLESESTSQVSEEQA